MRLLNPDLTRAVVFLGYRYRFLGIYVAIGVFSLVVEVLTYRGLERIGLAYPWCAAVGIVCGILTAYWGNVRFNFKVPSRKRTRALVYFTAISLLSWTIQFSLRSWTVQWGWSYEKARFALSASAFLLAYVLHRRFSFSDYKKVAVAVYANGIEDIGRIHRRIETFADMIHVDLVDASFGREDHEVRTYRLEVVRAYWPHHSIHAHVMSRHPSRYLPDLYPYVDRIYVHLEIDEDVADVLRKIRDAGKQAGLAVCLSTELERTRDHLSAIDGVLFLTIPTAGSSGQSFQMRALERIGEFNKWPERASLDVCVDGGVTERNVGLLNVEIVVSGSSVLNHPDPRRQIMRLQTSSNYEQV